MAKVAAALDGSRYWSPVAQTAAGPAMLERAGTTCLQGRNSRAWYDNTNEPTSVSALLLGFIAKHKQQSTAGDSDSQKWRCTKQRTWGN
jgi:hypothetical protein